ncbi:MAG: hypothetical protein IT290_00685 [Deltaproteobacteria bacterium]|nr:hypothetical protein [Deltaproteobacteria bacterium]
MVVPRQSQPLPEAASLDTDRTSLQRLSMPRSEGATLHAEQQVGMPSLPTSRSIKLSDIPADELREILTSKGVLHIVSSQLEADPGGAAALDKLFDMTTRELVVLIERAQRDARDPQNARQLNEAIQDITSPSFRAAVEKIRSGSRDPESHPYAVVGRLNSNQRELLLSKEYDAFTTELKNKLGWDTSKYVPALVQTYQDPDVASFLLSEEWRAASSRLTMEAYALSTNTIADFKAYISFLGENVPRPIGAQSAENWMRVSAMDASFPALLDTAHNLGEPAAREYYATPPTSLDQGTSSSPSEVQGLKSLSPEDFRATDTRGGKQFTGSQLEEFLYLAQHASQLSSLHRGISSSLFEVGQLKSLPPEVLQILESRGAQLYWDAVQSRRDLNLGTSVDVSLGDFIGEMTPSAGTSLNQVSPALADSALALGAEFVKLGFPTGNVGELMSQPALARSLAQFLADPESFRFTTEVLGRWPSLQQEGAIDTLKQIVESHSNMAEFLVLNGEIERRYGQLAQGDLDPVGAMKKVRIMDIIAREGYQGITPLVSVSFDGAILRPEFLGNSDSFESAESKEQKLDQTVRAFESPAMRVVYDQLIKRFSASGVSVVTAESLASSTSVVDGLRNREVMATVERIVWSSVQDSEEMNLNLPRIGKLAGELLRNPENIARRLNQLETEGQLNKEAGLTEVLNKLLLQWW